MTSPLGNRDFRWLFGAQICSLVGVGLLTVGLSLAAYRIGGAEAAGQVLGLLLALKMVAYVGLAPLAESLLQAVPRKAALVALDVGRMVLLIPMAFTTDIWQIATLSFLFFSMSAGFTPLYQSVIPDVVQEEDLYTKALSWSRVAYTLEAVLSPVIAGVLLTMLDGSSLFLVAALAFSVSITSILLAQVPRGMTTEGKKPFMQRASKGIRIYVRTPRLRGLFLLNLALSLSMAWVLVNTVAYAGARLGDSERYYPLLMTFYGMGAGLGAFSIPRLVKRIGERRTMALGAFAFAACGAVFAAWPAPGLAALGAIWIGFGLSSSLVLTPGGLVITRSANTEDRAAVFAAQFSLSHAGWLLAYPLAGWLATQVSLEMAMLLLSGLTSAVAVIALRVWPAQDPEQRVHQHPDLSEDHPHLRNIASTGPDHSHTHAYHIDDLHPHWDTGRH
jgi:MFS family permease